MGHVTITMPLFGTLCRRWATIELYTKFEIWKMQKLGWSGVLGVTQGHRQHSHPIQRNDFLFDFDRNYSSFLYHFRVIIAFFQKVWKRKDVTRIWPRPHKGQFVIPMLKHHMASHVTITMPLSGTVCFQWDCTSYDQPACQFTVSTFTHYEDMKGDINAKIQKLGWFGGGG